MAYRQFIETCLAEHIGEGGLSREVFVATLTKCGQALDRLRRRHAAGEIGFLRLAEASDDLPAAATVATRYRDSFERVVVLGTGGSSLGGQTLAALADHRFGPADGAPRIDFLDNVDPATFAALTAAWNPKKTGILAISKSGGTAETLTQLATLLPPLAAAVGDDALAGHVCLITEPRDSPLRRLGERHGLPVLDHPSDVGGRFSALSIVGLLPAMIAGLDAAAVRAGAAAVLRDALAAGEDAADCAAAVGAAINLGLGEQQGTGTTVVMPYVDRLDRFGAWFRQLWAESLGKGGAGTTPVRALGTVDQHSQLQLYLDGPRDKMFTLIGLAAPADGTAMSGLDGDAALGYLAGRTMGEVLAAEQRATADVLARNGRPVRRLEIDAVDEATLGALMMHFMLETVIAADLLGVDPYDQPAVEQGKALTRQYLAERTSE